MVDNPDQNVVSFSEAVQVCQQPDSLEVDRPSSPEPEPEPEHQSSPEPGRVSTELLFVELRRWHLHNRRVLLLRRTTGVEENKEEGAGEDGDQTSELEAIQKELEELAVKEEVLQKQLDLHPGLWKTWIHRLPRHVSEEEVTLSEPEPETGPEPEAKKPLSSPIPVDSLMLTSAVVQCPSCGEVIITEADRKVGRTMWILCCLSSVIGCVAGCCLIPFVVDRLKDVHHRCPLCQSHIHSYQHL